MTPRVDLTPEAQCALLESALIEGRLVKGKDFWDITWDGKAPVVSTFVDARVEQVEPVAYRAYTLLGQVLGVQTWQCFQCWRARCHSMPVPSPDCSGPPCAASPARETT